MQNPSPIPGAVDELPAPSPEAAAHSARLAETIRAEIDATGGAIPFQRFMELALYAPGLGYYTAGARKFGAAGDFVTAPELSPLFGRALARQVAEALDRLGGAEVLEIGAGSGALALELLGELEWLGMPPDRYLILERSADLRERQRERITAELPRLAGRVVWLDALPERFRGVVVANELLDAFAVRRFEITADGPMEEMVGWEKGFVRRLAPADAALAAAIQEIETANGAPLPTGYRSEICPDLTPWFAALGESLEAGLALFIDYGYPRREYYLPERRDGTLLCHYRHRVHADPFLHPGLQDITASVDFTAVADAALAAGLSVEGYTTQAMLLLGCGLEALMAEVDPDDRTAYLERVRQLKLLTLPGEMGERFQAIALARGVEGPWRGFAFADQRGRL